MYRLHHKGIYQKRIANIGKNTYHLTSKFCRGGFFLIEKIIKGRLAHGRNSGQPTNISLRIYAILNEKLQNMPCFQNGMFWRF